MNTHLTDFEPLAANAITLTDEQIDQAADMIVGAAQEAQQWQTYLLALAARGLQQWLSEVAPELSCSYDAAEAATGAVFCDASRLKLCLLASGSLSDEVVQIPEHAIARHDVHLYVLADVQEELRQVAIAAALRPDQLMSRQQK
ncbi:MAG: DUF1822 family protein, partial [Leptolyngbya sp. SIO4C5]|nr:DUF1822 family protein [Leptolyngbya sp. SIO4C5]